MENQFLIWLVDFGFSIKASEAPAVIDLLPEDKKVPSKVFEASIHGVIPIDKIINENCEIKDAISAAWTPAAIVQTREIIKNAQTIYFIPLALLSTNYNDIIVGDLYLEMAEKGFMNIADLLEEWPVFLTKNRTLYIDKISQCYKTRRRHRACAMKPNLPDLPTITLSTSLEEYNAICLKAPAFEQASGKQTVSNSSSVVANDKRCQTKDLKLTLEETEAYSKMYVEIAGREYNVLNILINKTQDLIMCEKYKDYDGKGFGRGTSFRKHTD